MDLGSQEGICEAYPGCLHLHNRADHYAAREGAHQGAFLARAVVAQNCWCAGVVASEQEVAHREYRFRATGGMRDVRARYRQAGREQTSIICHLRVLGLCWRSCARWVGGWAQSRGGRRGSFVATVVDL